MTAALAAPNTAAPNTDAPNTHAPNTDTRTPAASRAPGGHLRVVVRPAPVREPPFDDELREPPLVGPHDRRLPFAEQRPPAVRAIVTGRPAGLPDPAVWGRRLLIGLTESAAGRRPIQQLSSLLSLSVGRGLQEHLDPAGGHWLSGASIRSVLAGHPADGVAELAATVESGGRVRAVALRLEERRGRWCCTRLQLG